MLNLPVEPAFLDRADIFGLVMALVALCAGKVFCVKDKSGMEESRELSLREFGAWMNDAGKDRYALCAPSSDPQGRPSTPTSF